MMARGRNHRCTKRERDAYRRRAASAGPGIAPVGYAFLVDADGVYLVDADGAYLIGAV